jgi:hypothetical protein
MNAACLHQNTEYAENMGKQQELALTETADLTG